MENMTIEEILKNYEKGFRYVIKDGVICDFEYEED